MQKHAKNIQKMEPKWELESRTNEKNTWKMGRCTLHVRRFLWKWDLKSTKNLKNRSTEHFEWKMVSRTVRRGSPYFGLVPFWSLFGAEMVPRRSPVGPLGRRKWHQKLKNVAKKTILKSIPKKYRKTMPNLKDKGTKNYDKIDKKIVFFAKWWFCEKCCFLKEKACFFMFR